MRDRPSTIRLMQVSDEPRLRVFSSDWEIAGPLRRDGVRVVSSFELSAPIRRTIVAVRRAVADFQTSDGRFVDHNCRSARSLAELLLATHWLGGFDQDTLDRLAEELYGLQLDEGGWSSVEGQLADVGTSVLAYLALKQFDDSQRDESIRAARQFLVARGGLEMADPVACRYLALFGQIPFEMCLPTRCEDDACDDAWQRLSRRRAVKQPVKRNGVGELLRTPFQCWPGRGLRNRLRQSFLMKRSALHKLRKRWCSGDPHGAKRNLLSRWRQTIWNGMAAQSDANFPGRAEVLSELEQLKQHLQRCHDQDGGWRGVSQPGTTAAAIDALISAGMSARGASLRKAADVLCSMAPTSELDAAKMMMAACQLVNGPASSSDELPPDLQLVPFHTSAAETARRHDVLGAGPDKFKERFMDLLVGLQQRNGSWSGCPYVTAHCARALIAGGKQLGDHNIDQAIRFLRAAQRADGSWLPNGAAGSAGAVATTCQSIIAIRSAGLASGDAAIQAATSWLLAHQQPGGGWGEIARSAGTDPADERPASHRDTAVAVIALMASGQAGSRAVSSGIDYLLDHDFTSSSTTSTTADDAPLSLDAICATLHALCEWVAADNNYVRRTACSDRRPLRAATSPEESPSTTMRLIL